MVDGEHIPRKTIAAFRVFIRRITFTRSINLQISDTELAARRVAQDAKGWKPVEVRPRKVTTALKAYALLATSADKGAVRNKAMLEQLL